MNKKLVITSSIGVLVLLLVGVLIWSLVTNSSQVATVDGVGIEKTELEDELTKREQFLAVNEQEYDEATLESDTLNLLVDKQLIEAYADENGILISDDELQSYYASKVNSAENEEVLLADLLRLYGINKDEYLSNLSYDLLRTKVQEHVEQPLVEWLEAERNNSKITIKL